jgi:signal transduction histidine kinase
VNTIASLIYLALVDVRPFAQIIERNKTLVFTLSSVIAASSSFLMWAAYRRIKSETWMKYFACSFGLLAIQYFWLLSWLPTDRLNPTPESTTTPNNFFIFLVLQLISIVNNLYGVAAAQDIENKKPLLPLTCRLLLIASLGTAFLGYTLQAEPFQSTGNPIFYELLGRSFTAIFSAYCLFLMGRAIFSNISVRRHPRVARGAIFIASFYAAVQIIYGLSPLVAKYLITANDATEAYKMFDSVLIGIALPLKILLCGFAYLLVMRFFETLSEVRRLQDGGVDGRQDYLSSDGVVRLIGERLSTERPHDTQPSIIHLISKQRGFVNLAVRLPGDTNKRIACVLWPNDDRHKRARVLDWPEPTKFSQLDKDNLPETPQGIQWKKNLTYIGQVLTEEGKKELIFPKDNSERPARDNSNNEDLKAIFNVAIEAHGAAIGCLQVARAEHTFSQMAIRQIREIANLVSPSVQAYRELAGLDQMSIRFAEKQAEENPYPPEKATQLIARILHDIFSPTVTRLHMNFGFSTENPIYMFEEGKEHFVEKMKKEFADKLWDDYPPTIKGLNIEPQTLLKKQLTARVTETLSTDAVHASVADRFISGNLIFAINEKKDDYDHPALGITYLHRKAASTLADDAYLDFARDYYNDVLKKLGKELSQQLLNVDQWFEPVKSVIEEAHLSWGIVGQRKGKTLGDEEGLYLIQNLEQFAIKGEEKTFDLGEVVITHYKLKGLQSNSNHVLHINLQSSDCFIWLGVERPGFGCELEFSSPWRTFLVNFAQIADAALSRIIFPEKFQLQLEAAQLQGIITAVVTTGTMVHQLSNMIQTQSGSTSALLEAIKLKQLTIHNQELTPIIESMSSSAIEMQELFKSFTRLTKFEEQSPCKLREAADHAVKLFELSLLHRRIHTEVNIGEGLFVDVPYNVVALALANLVGNAKDAVSKDGDGKIWLEATKDGAFVLCRVRDNGKGINPEVRSEIFESRVATKEAGTGLGLYLTYHSLNENKSSIELTSSDETGSVFTIRFPLSKKEATV